MISKNAAAFFGGGNRLVANQFIDENQEEFGLR